MVPFIAPLAPGRYERYLKFVSYRNLSYIYQSVHFTVSKKDNSYGAVRGQNAFYKKLGSHFVYVENFSLSFRSLSLIKGGKFLKKLWCCVGGRV